MTAEPETGRWGSEVERDTSSRTAQQQTNNDPTPQRGRATFAMLLPRVKPELRRSALGPDLEDFERHQL